jgi:hypothetical protein
VWGTNKKNKKIKRVILSRKRNHIARFLEKKKRKPQKYPSRPKKAVVFSNSLEKKYNGIAGGQSFQKTHHYGRNTSFLKAFCVVFLFLSAVFKKKKNEKKTRPREKKNMQIVYFFFVKMEAYGE